MKVDFNQGKTIQLLGLLILQAICLISFIPMKVSAVNTHDIAITKVSPSNSVVRQCYNLTVSVILENRGNFIETFMLFIFCGYHQNITLSEQSSSTINYTFKTSGLPLGKCRTWAYVPPCFGDSSPFDNMYAGDVFKVTFLTDIDKNFKVDILDIARAARAFGSYLGHARWDADVDVDENKKIDILDIAKIAKDFGRTC